MATSPTYHITTHLYIRTVYCYCRNQSFYLARRAIIYKQIYCICSDFTISANQANFAALSQDFMISTVIFGACDEWRDGKETCNEHWPYYLLYEGSSKKSLFEREQKHFSFDLFEWHLIYSNDMITILLKCITILFPAIMLIIDKFIEMDSFSGCFNRCTDRAIAIAIVVGTASSVVVTASGVVATASGWLSHWNDSIVIFGAIIVAVTVSGAIATTSIDVLTIVVHSVAGCRIAAIVRSCPCRTIYNF